MQGNISMKISESEIIWLKSEFPNLQYDVKSQKIAGELDFCATYDTESGKVIIGISPEETEYLIRDVFEVEICLDILDGNGWAKVYEVGGRRYVIANKCNVPIIDLHFYTDDDACCLGLGFRNNRSFHIKGFIHELVIPFFYRLSYTEKFGIDACRNNLWGEYSHDIEGLREHEAEILYYAQRSVGRNELCPCKNGKKYKNCHFNEVESIKRSINRLCPCGRGKKYKDCHFDVELFLKRYLKVPIPNT